MAHSNDTLYNELVRIDNGLKIQIEHIHRIAESKSIDPNLVQLNGNGVPSMTPLLIARANCLLGMTNLKLAMVKR